MPCFPYTQKMGFNRRQPTPQDPFGDFRQEIFLFATYSTGYALTDFSNTDETLDACSPATVYNSGEGVSNLHYDYLRLSLAQTGVQADGVIDMFNTSTLVDFDSSSRTFNAGDFTAFSHAGFDVATFTDERHHESPINPNTGAAVSWAGQRREYIPGGKTWMFQDFGEWHLFDLYPPNFNAQVSIFKAADDLVCVDSLSGDVKYPLYTEAGIEWYPYTRPLPLGDETTQSFSSFQPPNWICVGFYTRVASNSDMSFTTGAYTILAPKNWDWSLELKLNEFAAYYQSQGFGVVTP